MDKLGEKALEYLTAFEELAKQYAPEVVDAGLAVVQINALGNVVFAVAMLLGMVVFVRWAVTSKWHREQWERADAGVMVGIVGSIFSLGAVVVGSLVLLNVWTWVALFNPKLYIAYKLFEKVL